MRVRDLTGDRYGKLRVIKRDENRSGRAYWICECDCGNIVSVRGSRLVDGVTKGCGCMKNKGTHGDAPRGGIKRLYRIYNNMLSRCNNPNSSEYSNYGGRGICVCKEWSDDYMAFKEWAIENGYSDELSIDRLNVNGNYEPDNCRWATRKEQSNNKSNHILITLNDVTLNAKQWSKKLGINYQTVVARYRKGLAAKDILSTVRLGGG